jgi:hypothetical protein
MPREQISESTVRRLNRTPIAKKTEWGFILPTGRTVWGFFEPAQAYGKECVTPDGQFRAGTFEQARDTYRRHLEAIGNPISFEELAKFRLIRRDVYTLEEAYAFVSPESVPGGSVIG